jgi:small subunit ribosomal protein S7
MTTALDPEPPTALPALTRAETLDGRYPALVEQLVGLLQQDGKKGIAQKNVALILHHLRTSPPPRLARSVPLLLGTPPASQLPLHPLLYLSLAVDSLAPLVRLRVERNQAGGGAGVVVPRPLRVRQRRRVAIAWIRDAADKKNVRQLGRQTRAHLIAQEIIAVVEGRSKLWEKRAALHKVAMSNRQHVGFVRRNIKKRTVFL